MSNTDPPKPLRPLPPPLTALEKLTFPDEGFGMTAAGKWRTGIYDYPDGEMCGSKILKSVKLATFVASFVSIAELGVFHEPKTTAMLVTRYLSKVLPAASAAAVFTSTNCLVGTIRNKDDVYNHAVGGCLGGAVLVAGSGKLSMGFGGCVIGAFLAALNKDALTGDLDYTRIRFKRVEGLIGHEDRYFGPRSTQKLPKEPTNY